MAEFIEDIRFSSTDANIIWYFPNSADYLLGAGANVQYAASDGSIPNVVLVGRHRITRDVIFSSVLLDRSVGGVARLRVHHSEGEKGEAQGILPLGTELRCVGRVPLAAASRQGLQQFHVTVSVIKNIASEIMPFTLSAHFRFVSLAAWNLKIISTISQGKTTFRIANAIVFGIGSLNYLWIIYDLNAQNGLSEVKQLISWIVLLVSFVLPTISPNSFRDRLMAIMSSLALPYALMSLSYEPLFLMTFTSNIYYWVSMIYTDKKQLYAVSLLR